MTAPKHTPGPWEVVGTTIRTKLLAPEDRTRLEDMGIDVASASPFLPERAANAALIAAAPELAEALRAIWTPCQINGWTDNHGREVHAWQGGEWLAGRCPACCATLALKKAGLA